MPHGSYGPDMIMHLFNFPLCTLLHHHVMQILYCNNNVLVHMIMHLLNLPFCALLHHNVMQILYCINM